MLVDARDESFLMMLRLLRRADERDDRSVKTAAPLFSSALGATAA